MGLKILGDILEIETISIGRAIKELGRLEKRYGPGRWRKMKGIAKIQLEDDTMRIEEFTGMSATALVKKNSRSSTVGRRKAPQGRDWAVCIDNESYEVSLERGKIYRVLPDRDAARHRMIRVIDESGEGYLFPTRRFMPIHVSTGLAQALNGKRRNGKARSRSSRPLRSAKS